MSTNTLLVILLVLLLIGVFPAWPYSQSWGNGPAGTVAVILVILLIVLLVTGRL